MLSPRSCRECAVPVLTWVGLAWSNIQVLLRGELCCSAAALSRRQGLDGRFGGVLGLVLALSVGLSRAWPWSHMAELDVLLPDIVAFQKLPVKTFFH